MSNTTVRKPLSPAQKKFFAINRKLKETGKPSIFDAKAPVAENASDAPKARRTRKPATVTITVESVEPKVGPTAGDYLSTKVAYVTKGSKLPKSGVTATVFGDAYATLKDSLVPGATVTVLANFNSKKGVGYYIDVVGLAA